MKTSILSLVFIAGCGTTITDGDRSLVYQNKGAGEFIESNSTQPEIQQAGKDVKENSTSLEKSVGLPKNPQPYTPEASKGSRENREQEHKAKWYDFILPALAGLIGGGGLTKILASVAPRIFGGPAGAALSAVISGVSAVREKAAANEDKKIHIDDIMAELIKAQEDVNVRELVRGWVKKVEEKIKA